MNEPLFFEIKSEGNLVRVEPIALEALNSHSEWDRNWIKTKVTLKGGIFSGTYEGLFMTSDFQYFKLQLQSMKGDLKESANFTSLEYHLDLVLKGDGIGHIEVNVVGRDRPYSGGGCLSFQFETDQTYLDPLINQLENITSKFPVTEGLQ